MLLATLYPKVAQVGDPPHFPIVCGDYPHLASVILHPIRLFSCPCPLLDSDVLSAETIILGSVSPAPSMELAMAIGTQYIISSMTTKQGPQKIIQC